MAGERGGRSSVAHGVGRERESEPRERERERERVREWARVGEEDVLAFNAAYGVAREGSMAGMWRRPTILGHGVDETECVADRPPSQTVRKAGRYNPSP